MPLKHEEDEPLVPQVLPEYIKWQPVFSRIQVPVDQDHPQGEAVVVRIFSVVGEFVFMCPPSTAKAMGQGLIEMAGITSNLFLPDGWNQDIPG